MKKTVFDELAGLQTESRNPDTIHLDSMSVREILDAMNREDRKVPDVLAAAIPQIEKVVEMVVASFQAGGRLIYIGAGTSGRLGVLDAAECPPTFGIEPWQVQGFIAGGYDSLRKAAEGAEDKEDGAHHDLTEIACVNHLDTVIGITASRRTPYVIGGLRRAKEEGAKTALLICNEPPDESISNEEATPPSPPALYGGVADVIISLPVGPELLTGSTRLKAGTATKLALNMITTAAWVRMGKCYENLMVDLRQGSSKLQARARRILMELTGCDYEWADELLTMSNGELKTALVMHYKGVTADHAREILEENGGKIEVK